MFGVGRPTKEQLSVADNPWGMYIVCGPVTDTYGGSVRIEIKSGSNELDTMLRYMYRVAITHRVQ